MSNYYLPLNVKKNDVMSPEFVRPMEGKDNGIYLKHKVKIVGSDIVESWFVPEFVEKLKSISEIWGAVIFNHKEVYKTLDAHTDVLFDDDQKPYLIHYGVNVVFDDSTDMRGAMRWYSMKDQTTDDDVRINPANTPYVNFKIEELNLEDEYLISDYVTLVKTDIPHNATSGNEFRTCLHIIFKENFDWETAVEKFSKTFN